MNKPGYLMIDHRASPGIPESVALAMGLDPKLMQSGKLFEADTLTCAHCKTVLMKNTLRSRERAHCAKCSHYICDGCQAESLSALYDHTPFQKKVDVAQDAAAKGFTQSSIIIP
jgi:hypothetical protein